MKIPENKTIQELFEWRFERTPKSVAHKFLDRETTYEELNIYSNQIANGLITLGCKPDSRIAYYGKNSDYFFEFLVGTLKSNTNGCGDCENNKYKYNKICVVESIADQWSIEASSVYKGYFHILGGTISSSNNQKKEDLLINSLADRIKKNNIEEVILATSATIEGQTTAFYIQDSLKNINVKISKLAQGLPVGGEIENLDDGTLISAFKNRQNF